jgi:aminoglycoside/choline kinase family phosphotransferase
MDDRFDKYWERIQRRALSIQDNPKLAQAYALFLQRQKDCPRTLCNGDFMQWNALWSDGNVLMIDWGFGGIMPYSLDIAREALINLARAICEEILHHKKANFRRNPVGFQGNSTHL